LHHLNLFLNYASNSRYNEIDGGFLLDYFSHLKQTKHFSFSSMKQPLTFTRFLFIDVLNKDIDFDFFIKMKKP